MIGHELLAEEGILVVSPIAPLEAADFERLSNEIDTYLDENDNLRGVVIEAESFPWWQNFAAMMAHFRFVRDHHRRVRKVAAVTDGKFLSVMPAIARLFVNAEVRHFPTEERELAYEWIREGAAPDFAQPIIG